MSLTSLLGRTATLTVARLTGPGAYLTLLDDPHAEPLLLPKRELPERVRVGDQLEVFVYLDSDDRPIATRREVRLSRGEVRFLEVRETTPIGAFVDWGLPKDLLVPFAEQTRALRAGDLEPFGLILDRSERLAGTMRIRELLRPADGRFALDEWVEGEAWREEPGLGLFCIIEGKYLGLLPASEPHGLGRGEQARFRVSHVLGDGKIELSLRGHVHEEIAADAERVLEVLRSLRGERIDDRASPALIRELFGMSKKAFKRAVGRLLREGAIELDPEGALVVRSERG